MQGQQQPTSAAKAPGSGGRSTWSHRTYLHISGPHFPQPLRKDEAGESSESHRAHLAVVRKKCMRSSTYKVFRTAKHACSTRDPVYMGLSKCSLSGSCPLHGPRALRFPIIPRPSKASRRVHLTDLDHLPSGDHLGHIPLALHFVTPVPRRKPLGKEITAASTVTFRNRDVAQPTEEVRSVGVHGR